jgi:hypothetical protein
VKVLRASFWQSDEVKLTYFIFLNPILMVAFMSGSYFNILVDTLFLVIVSDNSSNNLLLGLHGIGQTQGPELR